MSRVEDLPENHIDSLENKECTDIELDHDNDTPDNSEKDEEREEKKQELKAVLFELATTTTIHGIGNIVSANKTYKRLLWLSLWLLTFVGYCFQLSQIYITFTSTQKTTTMDLKFGVLKFPGVTFCNLNPVKKMFLTETSDDMQLFLTIPEVAMRYYSTPIDIEIDRNHPRFKFLDRFEKHGFNTEGWDVLSYIPTDPLQTRDLFIKSEISKMNRSTIEKIGHNIDDMLLHCSFNGDSCNSSLFTPVSSTRYGNCYTLQTDDLVSTVPGPPYGLTLMLDLETYEYVSPSSSGNGIKLVIHEPGAYPFVEEQGVNVAPGRSSIGLNRIEIQRLKPPQGNCDYHNGYDDKYGIKYSKMACEQLCQVNLTKDICDCVPTMVSIDQSSVTDSSSYCGLLDIPCAILVRQAQVKGDLHCPCTNPCLENKYSKTISSHSWPRQEYLTREIIPLICENTERAKKLENITGYSCLDITLNIAPAESVEPFRDNFVKLDIYFEDLNYEHIEEVPSYDEYQFLSDIGGATGLFIGASVLSLVEVIQILVEVLKYAVNRLRKK
ncbi:degenerin-like protein unc-105 [Ylistrum balloti]|uniref:degenerin-like protein unc-105 n=1 Tax=Ylistrum balloti TaxID=509963 RepID=UPI002905CEAB|nr:degenerin-like protein unc-105 [Ylistrum balloti]